MRWSSYFRPAAGTAITGSPAAAQSRTSRASRGAIRLPNCRRSKLISRSTGASAPLALRLILEQAERIEALVLIAPPPIFPELCEPMSRSDQNAALAERLAEIKAPTLLVLGTDDEVIPQETGGMYADRLPRCYYVLVYDAGHSVETDRPQTLFATVRDFLQRRETFVVNRASTVLNP